MLIRGHRVMTEDSFEKALSKPLRKAEILLARNPGTRRRLNKPERFRRHFEDDSEQDAIKQDWRKMFPDQPMPSSLALFKTALCLEWFSRRIAGHRPHNLTEGRTTVIVIHSDPPIITREVRIPSGRSISATIYMIGDSLMIKYDFSSSEICPIVYWRVFDMLRITLLKEPRALTDEP